MKFIYKRIILLSPLIILLFLLEACQKDEEKIILENPCRPPCWRNITPGKTEQEELVNIIESMPDINKKTVHVLGSWNNFDNVIEATLISKSIINFYIQDDKVVLIFISGKLGLTYFEAMEHFGDPDVITAARTLGPGRFLVGDSPLLYISAMIPENGIGFGFNTRDILMKSDEEISPDSKITNFDYYDPEYFETLLERGLFTMGNTWDFEYWRSNYK